MLFQYFIIILIVPVFTEGITLYEWNIDIKVIKADCEGIAIRGGTRQIVYLFKLNDVEVKRITLNTHPNDYEQGSHQGLQTTFTIPYVKGESMDKLVLEFYDAHGKGHQKPSTIQMQLLCKTWFQFSDKGEYEKTCSNRKGYMKKAVVHASVQKKTQKSKTKKERKTLTMSILIGGLVGFMAIVTIMPLIIYIRRRSRTKKISSKTKIQKSKEMSFTLTGSMIIDNRQSLMLAKKSEKKTLKKVESIKSLTQLNFSHL